MSTEIHQFPAGDGTCTGQLHRPPADTPRTGSGTPCVILGHAFGGTRSSGLDTFAAAFAVAGFAALAFDYRGFGASPGEPRGELVVGRQLDDYRAAIAYARTLPGIDPDRIVVWGLAMSGGYVVRLAAEDQRLAGAIALTPATDELAAALVQMRRGGATGYSLRTNALVWADIVAARIGRRRVRVPIVGEPDQIAVFTAPGAAKVFREVAGPDWTNSVPAAALVGVCLQRPARFAKRITAPVLFQIADEDQTAPPGPAVRTASRARAQVHHYPCDHFDVYPGGPWHAKVLRDQIAFLTRRFGPDTEAHQPSPATGGNTRPGTRSAS
ncbi:alpha/beta hydrolase [Streptomyces sp. NPDC002623]